MVEWIERKYPNSYSQLRIQVDGIYSIIIEAELNGEEYCYKVKAGYKYGERMLMIGKADSIDSAKQAGIKFVRQSLIRILSKLEDIK